MTTTRYASYKGKTYRLGFLGQTKYGRRAKLASLDGSKEFWVAAELVTESAAPAASRPTSDRGSLRGRRTGCSCGSIDGEHVRLVTPIGDDPGFAGEIAINGRRYICGQLPDGSYRLHGPDGVLYEVNFLLDHCTCPAYRYRRGLCKHCKALAALWKAGKLP